MVSTEIEQTKHTWARTLDDRCMGIEFMQLKPEDAERLQEFLLPMILERKEPTPRAS